MTAGLLRHLRDRGLRVAAAKAGPDYIDPTFHALASGGDCLNLDAWAMRPATLARLVAALEAAAEIVLCEGVMGLFDGTGRDGEAGSTAVLAAATGWPVVLVVDARRQGASAAALVSGFVRHDPRVRFAGVIFNRVAGERHRAILATALARHLPEMPCLGFLPAEREMTLPERHLGLVPAAEHAATAEAAISRAASTIAEQVDVPLLLGLVGAGGVPSALRAGRRISGDPAAVPLPPLGQRIGVARDDAFVFAYPAVLAGWRAAGAELSFFSPLADEAPDPAADVIYLPGGYPELHAGKLAAGTRFLGGLRDAAMAGVTIYGECGGYMVLGDSLTDADARAHRMAGLLPLATSFAERRLHLGYREARLLTKGALGSAGAGFRGHEFHYATTVSIGNAEPLFRLSDSCAADLGTAGLRRGSVLGSFVHLIDCVEG